MKESSRPDCIHHHDITSDYRKSEEKDCKRAWNSFRAMGMIDDLQG